MLTKRCFVARSSLIIGAALIVAAASRALAASGDAAAPAKLVGSYVLPDIPLSAVEHFITQDRKFLLASVGSDLWHDRNAPPNRFWMISDRGPNGRVKVRHEKRRTFPVPEFSPLILHVELQGEGIRILDKLPLVDSHGIPVTGLPNTPDHDETPYSYDALQPIAYNRSGLDTEGLARASHGDFWLCEEYSPSLVHCDAKGKVLKRYIPAGLRLETAGYPVAAALPAIFARRKVNRGFEGLTLSPDEKTVYAVMQSPLLNPNQSVGEKSRNVRLLVFSIAAEKPVAEYVYHLERYRDFDPGAKKATAMKISGLAMLTKSTMLVLERTDDVARLYKIDLAKATNILGSKWDDASASPSLEAIKDLAAAGVNVLPKTLAVDLSKLPHMPRKIEGIAVIDARTIAVANDNDNDFDIGTFDAAGNNRGRGIKNLIQVIRVEAPLF
jgi:hypothetical protein